MQFYFSLIFFTSYSRSIFSTLLPLLSFIFFSCSFSFYNFAIKRLFDILCTSMLIFFFGFNGDFFLYDALWSVAKGLLLNENIASSLDWWCLVDYWMLDNWLVDPKYLKGSNSWRFMSKFCFFTVYYKSYDNACLLYRVVLGMHFYWFEE